MHQIVRPSVSVSPLRFAAKGTIQTGEERRRGRIKQVWPDSTQNEAYNQTILSLDYICTP